MTDCGRAWPNGLIALRSARRASLIVVTSLAALLTTACTKQEKQQMPLLDELHARLDPKYPGYGIADYPGNGKVHVPKSYAKVLLAEVERKRNGYRPDLPDLSNAAGHWLLAHSDEDKDGVAGWGVPVAWDAYGDKSENPANTVYTISVAIVVDALLTWMENDTSAPGDQILKTVQAALQPFTAPDIRSPSGMLPYSFVKSDRAYDTFNPAAYMAGQMQRFARFTTSADFAKQLTDTADETVRVLVEQKKINPETGSWYWNYSIQENTTNDLPHASYIIDGLLKYSMYGGSRAKTLDLTAITKHLREFYDPSKKMVRGWPKLQETSDRPARSYDIGMAMSLVCTVPEVYDLAQQFYDFIPRFRDGSRGYLSYPVDQPKLKPILVNEYEAYLYQGVVACNLVKQRQQASTADSARSAFLATKSSALSPSAPEIPFIRLNGEANTWTEVKGAADDPLRFAISGLEFRNAIPVSRHAVDDGEILFVQPSELRNCGSSTAIPKASFGQRRH